MKIGVVGLGSIGQRHAENARKLGHEVKAYDPAAAGDFRFERQLYDWCDAAVIATPSMFHEGPLRACIERGKHALIEKPISTSIGTLPLLLSVAGDKRLVVMSGNNLRFHACVKRAKDYIDSGSIGEPRWANFICATEFTSTAARDGVILNTGSHEVDLAMHLFGDADVLIASARRPGPEWEAQEISADFALLHESGARSLFHIDIDTTDRVRQFIISGSEKSIPFDLDRRTVGDYTLGGSYVDDYMAEMKAFIERIEDPAAPGPAATGSDALDCLRVLLDIRKRVGLP